MSKHETEIKLDAGSFSGLFKLQTKNAAGEITQETEWQKNLITDFGLNYICSADNRYFDIYATYIAVGTGSTTPNVTDVTLTAQLGARVAGSVQLSKTNSGAPFYYSSLIRSWTYAQGAIVGNIAEVGLFNAATGANAMTHALVRDSGGVPTTFTVLATETLTVVYELRYYPNLITTSGTFVIGSTTYNYTQSPQGVTGVDGAGISVAARGHSTAVTGAAVYATQSLPAIGVGPAGTAFTATNYSYAPYTTGSFTNVETITWGPTEGNVPGGIGLCNYGAYVRAQSTSNQGFNMTISPVINKTNLQTLTLTFSLTYGRYTI